MFPFSGINLPLVLPSITDWAIGFLVVCLVMLIFWLPSLISSSSSAADKSGGRASRFPGLNAWLIRWPAIGQSRFAFWEEQLRLANAPLRPAELYLIALGLGIAGFLLMEFFMGYVLLSVFLGGVAVSIPFLLIRRRAQRNHRLIALQVESLCQDLAAAAEAGASRMQLLEQAAEVEPPLGNLFARVLVEVDQGVSSVDALERLRAREQHPQINRFIHALQLHFERGAPIAQLLRQTSEEMRVEEELVLEMQTRLEQPRFQFWIVCLLSIPMLLYFRWQDPSAVNALFGSLAGQLYYMALWGITLFIYYIVKRLTRIEGL